MADSKISALPASTTPLAGTEVLPIVQSSTTKQVSVANLTAGRAVSALSLTSTTTLGVTGTSTLSGNAIISVTDNTNAALRITQLGSGNALLVEDSTNPDATPFVIDTVGRVVVGTTAAQIMAGTTPAIQLHAGGGSALQALVSWGTNGANRGDLQFLRSASGVVGTNGAVASGFDLGALNFYGDDGAAFIQAAQILAEVDGTPGTNDMPGRLVFSTTADGASSPTERMRINSSGTVSLASTTEQTGTTGAMTVAGGVYVAKILTAIGGISGGTF